MTQRWTARLAWLGVALLPLLLLWPLPTVFRTHLLAAPDQEAAPHTWGLWAALHTGQPLVLQSDLLGYPDGASLVLVDPGNLPAFALGLIWGPAAAYNMVLVVGLLVMGAAGALLARQVDGDPVVGAVAALACPTLLANAADGMTEGFGVGWVGLQLAFVLRWRDHGRGQDLALAAVTFALAAWTGPYNGVWAALVDAGVGAGALLARDRRAVARLLAVPAASGPLVAPLAWAIARHRPDHLPGSEARAGLPPALAQPELFRGGLRYGADLLDPWLPGLVTGGEAPVSHTAYLGVVALCASLVAAYREPRLRPWLVGAAAFAALSLGPRLYLAGQPLMVAGRGLLGPAGGLVLAAGFFGRITRWYRAGAVASLLLAPLLSRASPSPRWRAGLAALVVADTLLLAPLAWPLHHAALPDAAPFQAVEAAGEGAILELPPVTSATPPPGAWRDQVGLLQPQHGRPVGGSMMRLPVSPAARRGQAAVERWLRQGRLPATTLASVRADGFRWLAIYPPYRPMPPGARARLEACFGAPVGASAEVWVFDLDNAPEAGCERSSAERPP